MPLPPVDPELFERHKRLAFWVLAKYGYGRRARRLGVPVEDVEQVALLALALAVRRHTPERGELTTLAVRIVRDEVRYYLRGWRPHVGLPVFDDGTTIEPAAPDGPDADAAPDVATLLKVLDARSRLVVELHFGLGGREPLDFGAIGLRLGVSAGRAGQVVAAALAKMRRAGGGSGRLSPAAPSASP